MSPILLPLIVPAVGAVAIGLLGRWPNLRETALLVTAAVLFWMVVGFYPEVIAGGRPGVTLLEVAPGLTLRLEIEPLGIVFIDPGDAALRMRVGDDAQRQTFGQVPHIFACLDGLIG